MYTPLRFKTIIDLITNGCNFISRKEIYEETFTKTTFKTQKKYESLYGEYDNNIIYRVLENENGQVLNITIEQKGIKS